MIATEMNNEAIAEYGRGQVLRAGFRAYLSPLGSRQCGKSFSSSARGWSTIEGVDFTILDPSLPPKDQPLEEIIRR
jgi:hypothetical protein